MAHTFDIEVSQNWISCEGPSVTSSGVTHMCFVFALREENESAASGEVQVLPIKKMKQAWLYGPATDLPMHTLQMFTSVSVSPVPKDPPKVSGSQQPVMQMPRLLQALS